jgi:signal transduction histidine kinase
MRQLRSRGKDVRVPEENARMRPYQEVDPGPAVADVERLAALHRQRLLDTPPEDSFDRLAHLARRVLRAPTALVSLVDKERQFFKSCFGLAEPWATRRETPLSYSFCQYAVATASPLVIEDARNDPLLAENPAVEELGVVAYAGVPVIVNGGQALGTLCVIDSKPRQWSQEDVGFLHDLACTAADLVEMRLADLESAERKAAVAELVRAQEDERARIAAEVHDDSLQTLIALSIRLQLAAERVEDRQLRATLGGIVDAASGAAERLRQLLLDLRPPALEHGTLADALESHMELCFGDTSVDWQVRNHLDTEVPPDTAVILFRITQAAMANVLTHAGASGVELELTRSGPGVALSIRDDGRGFDPSAAASPGHLGLVTMRERAEMGGGFLRVETGERGGTTVRVWLPVDGLDAESDS